MDRLSPDGTIRVEIAASEWANSHWVHSPRVIDVPTGRIVLDLWNTDWDATVDFPGPRRVVLDFRRYRDKGQSSFSAELDLERWTWRNTSKAEPEEAPLEGIARGLELAYREASRTRR